MDYAARTRALGALQRRIKALQEKEEAFGQRASAAELLDVINDLQRLSDDMAAENDSGRMADPARARPTEVIG